MDEKHTTRRPASPYEPWCSQHQARPNDCWHLHNKESEIVHSAETPEQMRDRIAKTHLEKQRLLTLCDKCEKFTDNLIDHLRNRCKVAKEERESAKW